VKTDAAVSHKSFGVNVMEKRIPAVPSRNFLISFLFLTIIACFMAAYVYYRSETDRIREQRYQELASVADLKARQIHQWRNERLADAEVLSRSPLFRKQLQNWFLHKNDNQIQALLMERLRVGREAYGYSDVLIVTP
jgi:hypothetical protein